MSSNVEEINVEEITEIMALKISALKAITAYLEGNIGLGKRHSEDWKGTPQIPINIQVALKVLEIVR